MHARRTILLALIVLGLCACAHPLASASQARVSLQYVGQVSFGSPMTTTDDTTIPLVINFGAGQWGQNSARVLYGTTARQRGSNIEFSVSTSLPAGNTPPTPELRLPKLAPGEYGMVYVDPDGSTHPVGRVKIGI